MATFPDYCEFCISVGLCTFSMHTLLPIAGVSLSVSVISCHLYNFLLLQYATAVIIISVIEIVGAILAFVFTDAIVSVLGPFVLKLFIPQLTMPPAR